MKIFPIADLHIESSWKPLATYRGNPDVVVAAGDMHVKTKGPEELRRIFGNAEIIYVPGNHEYYGSALKKEDELLREDCKEYGIHFLQCDSVELQGVVFLGCTLWTDFELFGPEKEPECRFLVGKWLRDYHVIKLDPGTRRMLSTLATQSLHQKHKSWLQEQFQIHKGKKLVVVTHHGPSSKCIHPSYTKDLVSAGFASDLDSLVEQSGAKYWICGHSHTATRFEIGNTEVVMNSAGYAKETVPGFEPFLELLI
ncbi:Calcineurin-like phosphoesterase superfamily domain-containing protein [Malonomonas rubra DSM 5091]|uniref:Calcineurin-like phosphoesterase superfamily domain-containing protein n=1 Tax=Malonomonas rubra DSM 5091 TaxID=1122189 RepID=A0A1M6H9Q2_MALRU|nr:metallophosphoesterase [Malonomonas rubra]SHJ18941.1 Calcineurin-like phosphoesterase superfamily domain-containing protein [Malonomonas rubra DSM 5091]